jgi:putative FmdB family regulatory protein
MPTYEYECQQCHERVEAVQKFTDAALTVCPLCEGELRKVFSAVGIVFKGSGFYKNDSRNSTASVTPPSSTDTKSESSTPAPASTPSDGAAKPAAPAAPASPSTTSTSTSSSS